MNYKRIAKKHGFTIACALIAAVTTLQSWDVIQARQEASKRVQAQVSRNSERGQVLDVANEAIAETSRIAESRYQSGCTPIVSVQKGRFTAITEKTPIVSPDNNQPLPQGMVVCDIHGNTGLIGANGYPTDLAYTGNQKLVSESIRKYQSSFAKQL